jgi:phosphoserine phosphatase
MAALRDSPPPYATVAFDCDSTLSAIEGIEELARDCRAEVERLTARAMDGRVPLEEVYGARLELIRPTRAAVAEVAEHYARHALPHARELVAALRALGKRVVVVSGGLLPAVLPFALGLGLAGPEDVLAVDLRFDPTGAYAGFDETSPLARSGGKIGVLRALAAGAGALAFVGDGATDLEAGPEAARFIAFGGVVRRERVFEAALVACAVPDFAALLPLLLSTEERARLVARGGHAVLLEASARLSP